MTTDFATIQDAAKVFTKDKTYYTRDLDPIQQYIEQSAFYLSTMTGDDIEKCREWVKRGLKEKQFPNLRDPTVKYYERQDNGDKVVKECRLSYYIKSLVQQNQIVAPSFTTYCHPTEHQSVIVDFIDANVKRRAEAKTISQKAKADGNHALFIFMDNEQTNMKLGNNSVSGGFVAVGSVLHNPTAHSSLTSTTRTVASFANASNERIIGGNRHYHSPYVTINNIVTVVMGTDYVKLEAVMAKWQLVYPTVDETMACIDYCTKHYWSGHHWVLEVRRLIERLTPIQRAAFVYTGDLYHIRKLNDGVVREFLGRLSRKVHMEVDNPLTLIKTVNDAILNLAHQICFGEVMGRGKKYDEMLSVGVLHTVVGTVINICQTLWDYKDFIEVFFLSDNVPASVAYLPDMIRQGVVLSDTDSTCVAKDEWVKWYRGSIIFDNESRALAGSVMYIATESLVHTLALFSANINVAKDKLNTLAMKSEFFWDVMIPTNVAKHYFAWTRIKEGNVYAKPEEEIKGVHLRNSNTPGVVRHHAKNMMIGIMEKISNNEKISLRHYTQEIVELEQRIETSLLKGELTFFRKITVKDAEAYTQDEDVSFYRWHLFWQEIFEAKYGPVEEPPYTVIKISVSLDNRTQLKAWLEGLKDAGIKNRLAEWLIKNGKTSLPTLYLPANYITSFGMLEELTGIIDTKKIILDIMNCQYIIMESMGHYKKPDMLFSDYYRPALTYQPEGSVP